MYGQECFYTLLNYSLYTIYYNNPLLFFRVLQSMGMGYNELSLLSMNYGNVYRLMYSKVVKRLSEIQNPSTFLYRFVWFAYMLKEESLLSNQYLINCINMELARELDYLVHMHNRVNQLILEWSSQELQKIKYEHVYESNFSDSLSEWLTKHGIKNIREVTISTLYGDNKYDIGIGFDNLRLFSDHHFVIELKHLNSGRGDSFRTLNYQLESYLMDSKTLSIFIIIINSGSNTLVKKKFDLFSTHFRLVGSDKIVKVMKL